MGLCLFFIVSRCKDTKVERNGKIYFDIPEMKYLRERSESKIRKKYLTARKKVHACAFLVHDITFCDFRSTIKYGENGNVTPDLKVFRIFATQKQSYGATEIPYPSREHPHARRAAGVAGIRQTRGADDVEIPHRQGLYHP